MHHIILLIHIKLNQFFSFVKMQIMFQQIINVDVLE